MILFLRAFGVSQNLSRPDIHCAVFPNRRSRRSTCLVPVSNRTTAFSRRQSNRNRVRATTPSTVPHTGVVVRFTRATLELGAETDREPRPHRSIDRAIHVAVAPTTPPALSSEPLASPRQRALGRCGCRSPRRKAPVPDGVSVIRRRASRIRCPSSPHIPGFCLRLRRLDGNRVVRNSVHTHHRKTTSELPPTNSISLKPRYEMRLPSTSGGVSVFGPRF